MQFYRHRTNQDLLRSVFSRLPDTLLMELDRTHHVQLASAAWEQVLGLPVEELQGRDFLSLLFEEDREGVRRQLDRLGAGQNTLRFACRMRRGEHAVFGLSWSVSFDAEQDALYVSAHETAVNFLSGEVRLPDTYLDGLTGLPNRTLFVERLDHTLRRARRRRDMHFAVLHCGIDRFKVVNHSLGNRLGDQLLVAVANVLRATIRPTDMVARMGGDEFAILLDEVQDASSPLRVVNRIRERLVLPFPLHDHEVYATVSAGIALGSGDTLQADHLLRDASMAMTRAKQQGGGGYVLFDKLMHDQAVRRLELELDLRTAVEQEQFEPYYQPIVRLQDGRISGFEALVRWQHPSRGLVAPGEFIPMAEATGMIVPIGLWMLDTACAQLARWQAAFPLDEPLTMSVNLSPRQLMDEALPGRVVDILRRHGVAPTHLRLEITESVMMEDPQRALWVLEALHREGVRLSLDDFGTGYSSLSYLHRMPVDTLKVDRAFVMNIHASLTDRGFVETIVRLAHQLGRDVVCEGVELAAQAKVLSTLQVEYAQGYLYSRPVTANEAEMLLIEQVHEDDPDENRND